MELITGATGYVGGLVLERLLEQERPVRALARDPDRLESRPGLEVARGDLLSGEGLEEALEGCSCAYYLVHSMERVGARESSAVSDFADRDRQAARNFAAAAGRAGVERVVYLGGLLPASGAPSPHLASRFEVEEILLEALPRSTALRASILIGARSASFRLLVRLVERLRVLPFPGWREHRTRPIDSRDAVEYLARTPQTPDTEGRSLDIAGPDVVSYAEIVECIADAMGVGRVSLALPTTQTPAASAVVAAIVEQPVELVRPLMESLEHELLPRDDSAAEIYGIRPRPLARAVERALRDWEAEEVLAAR